MFEAVTQTNFRYGWANEYGLYNEYMGGLKIYSNQYCIRNKFTVYIQVPSIDDGWSNRRSLWRSPSIGDCQSNRRSLCRSSSIVDRRQSAIESSIGDRCGVDRHRIVDRCGDRRSNRRSPSIADRHRIVDHCGDRRSNRRSPSIVDSRQSSIAVNLRWSIAVNWRSPSIGDRRSNRRSLWRSIVVNRRSSIESSIVVAIVDL